MKKTCTKCGRSKELSLFIPKYGKSKRYGKGSVSSWCKKCHSEDGVARIMVKKKDPLYRENRRLYARKRRFARRYGITIDDYQAMFAKQGNACAACRTKKNTIDGWYGTEKQFPVDHDHITGKIRGILCDRCNRGLGLLKDSIPVLKALIAYLRKHGNETTSSG